MRGCGDDGGVMVKRGHHTTAMTMMRPMVHCSNVKTTINGREREESAGSVDDDEYNASNSNNGDDHHDHSRRDTMNLQRSQL